MAIKNSVSDRALYERLYVSAQDFALASQYARYLLKKGWHSAPYERRGTIYLQQSAFTTSLVMSYARPFTKGKGWPKFPDEFIHYDDTSQKLHDHVLNLRHQVYAHSDSSRYQIRPYRIDNNIVTDIVGAPFLRLSKEECELIIEMIAGIHKLLSPRIQLLQGKLADSPVA